MTKTTLLGTTAHRPFPGLALPAPPWPRTEPIRVGVVTPLSGTYAARSASK